MLKDKYEPWAVSSADGTSFPTVIERARMISGVDNRAQIVLAHAIAPRNKTAEQARKHQKLR